MDYGYITKFLNEHNIKNKELRTDPSALSLT